LTTNILNDPHKDCTQTSRSDFDSISQQEVGKGINIIYFAQKHTVLTFASLATILAFVAGCAGPYSAHTWSRDFGLRWMPSEAPKSSKGLKYDQQVDGGTLYKQHCSRCHNARPLGERSFAQNEMSLAHMRNLSGLTGEEYRKIIQYMRRWHGVGPATPEVETPPHRLFFSSPDRRGTLDSESMVPADEKIEKVESLE
jgi:hypothetical protein